MKSKTITTILTLTLALSLGVCAITETPKAQAQAETIRDNSLKTAINDNINKNHPHKAPRNLATPITLDDLASLNGNLDASDIVKRFNRMPISDLTGIENATNLVGLYLKKNLLTNLPYNIGNINNLKYLYVSENILNTIPTSIENFVDLEDFDVSYNHLETIPKEIGENKQLEHFSAKHNFLKQLPEEFGQLSQLETLDLSYNQITSLDRNISELENLISVNLNNNEIYELPSDIGHLDNLDYLDVSNNNIDELPETIRNAEKLKNLHILNNYLFDISYTENILNIDAKDQTIFGDPIHVDAAQQTNIICNNVFLPIRWDGSSVLPTESPKYIFFPKTNEQTVRGGIICWHNVPNQENTVSYNFKTNDENRFFSGTVKFDLIRENINQISDPNLQTVINQKINEDNPNPNKKMRSNNNPISVADLKSLQGSLDAKNRNILNLTGLEHALHLDFLRISGNPVKDLTPTAGLPFRIEADTQQDIVRNKNSPNFKLDEVNMSVGTGLVGLTALVGYQIPTVLKGTAFFSGSNLEMQPLLATNTIEAAEITTIATEGTELGATVGSIEPGGGTLLGAGIGLLGAGAIILTKHHTYLTHKIKNFFNRAFN